MDKFKVGDKVKVLGNKEDAGYYHKHNAGTLGEVVYVYSFDDEQSLKYEVEPLDKTGPSQSHKAENLVNLDDVDDTLKKMVSTFYEGDNSMQAEYMVGDMVKVKEHDHSYHGHKPGEVGRIINIYMDGEEPGYDVLIDETAQILKARHIDPTNDEPDDMQATDRIHQLNQTKRRENIMYNSVSVSLNEDQILNLIDEVDIDDYITFYDMSTWDDLMSDFTPIEVIDMIDVGDFNTSDQYAFLNDSTGLWESSDDLSDLLNDFIEDMLEEYLSNNL